MRSRPLILAFAGFCIAFGAALWWFQTRAFYTREDGVTEIEIQGSTLPVVEYDGIDAATSPLKLRACFRIADGVAPDALQHVAEAEAPTPLVAPSWFECFDAAEIAEGIEAGPIRAVLAARNTPYGFDRIVAAGPDGRGWMWRQINACGTATFDGKPLPDGCPPAPED
ncbi:hypothetical protein SAMN05444336_101425 [Albimonas donghaensis]|uniref:Histidine kinase n=1 Tax=Albimonas donghaensis TaxID=356660 RepID=A0A1H2RRQ3_9RHOB|nr:DUF6446 family protein [Albimonas donghaensis]SDW21309.1 hypothetical protein SAMN05444336_101425 [Albimonas donghaensis]